MNPNHISRVRLSALRFSIKYRLDDVLMRIIQEGRYSRMKLALRGKSRFAQEFHKRKIIFVHIPKNGGSSISQSLFNSPSLTHQHHRLFDYYSENSSAAAGYYKFCVVRNPWDRLVSAFFYLKDPPQSVGAATKSFSREFISPHESFEHFVAWLHANPWAQRWIHLRPQWEYIAVNGQVSVDRMIRFESMLADYERAMSEAGIVVARPLSHINRSGRDHDYREYYSESTRAMVNRLYAKDVEMLGYDFGGC